MNERLARNLWVSGVVVVAMSPATLTAGVLTKNELDMVTAGQVQITPRLSVTSITGNLSSIGGLTASFSTFGNVSISSVGVGDITSLPASITGTLSSIDGLTAKLVTESGYVVRVTATDAAVRSGGTQEGQSQRVDPAGTRHHKAESWRSSGQGPSPRISGERGGGRGRWW